MAWLVWQRARSFASIRADPVGQGAQVRKPNTAIIAKSGFIRQLKTAVRANGAQELAACSAEAGAVSIVGAAVWTHDHGINSYDLRISFNPQQSPTIKLFHRLIFGRCE